MKLSLILFAICSILPGCVNPSSPSGVYRPTLSTIPKSYVATFPVNRATEQEVIQYVGNPDKTTESNGTKYATINIAPAGSNGVIEYTYEIQRGIVTKVTYLNSGNFFGVTQRETSGSAAQ